MNLDGAVIDSSVIGGTTPAAGTFTTLTANTSITGTLATAAQPNITSVGTLTGFTSTGIDDNATSTAITIDSSENVGIGTSNPTSLLNIDKAQAAETIFRVSNTSTSAGSSAVMTAEGSSNKSIDVGIRSVNDSAYGALDAESGFVWYDGSTSLVLGATNAAGIIKFNTGGISERMRIDSSGNLLVGTTESNPTSSAVNVAGQAFSTTGGVRSTVASNPAGTFNRKTDDGDIVIFRKDGTTVGSIGTYAGHLRLGSGSANLLCVNAQGFLPAISDGTASNGSLDLGEAGRRFKNLYLSGGVYVGGTTSANYLDDYEEGTWTPVASGTGYSFGTHSGAYVKVGDLVYVTASIVITTVGTNTSSIGLSGFPFTSYGLHQAGIARESATSGKLFVVQINLNNTLGSINSMDGIASGSNKIFTTDTYALSLTYRTS
jgi:hypothetical protein